MKRQMDRNYVECISICKQYPGRHNKINALSNINLKVEESEFLLIKGRSGAGKSTLLHLIGGLIAPTSGTIRIGNKIVNRLDNKSLSLLLRNSVGIIFQSLNLLSSFDIYENIEAALIPSGLRHQEMEARILPLLEQFGLSDKMNMLPSELSLGQQQKVAIIRTIVKKPALILADEPTGSLDTQSASEILGILRSLNRENKITVILTTHGSVTENVADRTVVLENGTLI